MLFDDLDERAILIRSGSHVAAFPPNYLTTGELRLLEVEKLVATGAYVVFRFSMLYKESAEAGVGILSLALRGLKIRTLDLFL